MNSILRRKVELLKEFRGDGDTSSRSHFPQSSLGVMVGVKVLVASKIWIAVVAETVWAGVSIAAEVLLERCITRHSGRRSSRIATVVIRRPLTEVLLLMCHDDREQSQSDVKFI